MHTAGKYMVTVLTVAAWVALVVDALPWWDMRADTALLVQTVAALGTCWFIVRGTAAPALEVYLAGKRAGRSEVLAEQECGVTQLTERRLTVVGD